MSCRLLSFTCGRQLNVGRLQSRLGLKKPCGKVGRGAKSSNKFSHILIGDSMQMNRVMRWRGGRGGVSSCLSSTKMRISRPRPRGFTTTRSYKEVNRARNMRQYRRCARSQRKVGSDVPWPSHCTRRTAWWPCEPGQDAPTSPIVVQLVNCFIGPRKALRIFLT